MTLGISIALILSLILSGTLALKAASSAAASVTSPTRTPIKNLVVIFQENVSFDHYFGTYPNATNPPREPKFTTDSHTPSVKWINSRIVE
jgi:phospholipase C